jgi:2-polyprenyl-3-methyl-5-hydroxy-6-metoxy-1,4-benzoquinol methylase
MPEIVLTCDLCSSSEHDDAPLESSVLGLPPPYRVVRCRACGLRYLSPRPTPQEYSRMYESEYFEGDEHYSDHLKAKVPDFRAQYDLIERFSRPGNRLLEIGCATGQFLQIGAQRGWRVTGVEVSRWAARHSRKDFGLNVVIGRFEELAIPPGMFDAMVMTHVLEHLESPRRALRQAWTALKDGGLLFVEVPNQFGELWFRAALPWIKYRAAKRRPMLVHTHFFLPRQFVRLVESSGFVILATHTMRRTYPPMKGAIPGGTLARRVSHLVGGLVGQGPICTVLARKSDRMGDQPHV